MRVIIKVIGTFVVLFVGLWVVSQRSVHGNDPCLDKCDGAFNTCVANASQSEDACTIQVEFSRDSCYLNAAQVYEDCVNFMQSNFPTCNGCPEVICLPNEYYAQNLCEDAANNAEAVCQNAYSTAYDTCANAYTNCANACPTPTP
jgi:hypothetical protein